MSHRSYPSDYSNEERASLVARGRLLVALRNHAQRQLGWRVLDLITFHGRDSLQRFAEDLGVTPSTLIKYADSAAQSSLRRGDLSGPGEIGQP
ncbi:hypothetical protein ADK35_39275 [Streptomyces viridochromogenes]|nr:hypothetical protein ADK35_39275 [Streptomyces viridochromogenes]KOG10159.1 hypothetical protein ADK36_39460 [Streptomyces viridochromogenes]